MPTRAVVLLAALLPAGLGAQTLALEGVELVATGPGVVRSDVTVLVRDGRVVAVGSAGDVRVPDDAVRLAGRGRYLMPGLVEMHVHLREERLLGLYLAHGFTTVRDMAGHLGDTRRWRDEVARGERIGPRIVAASPILFRGSPDSRPYPVDTPEQARTAARAVYEAGYDLVKVYRLERAPFRALVDEARRLGIPVAGHHPDVVHDQDDEAPLDIPNEEVLASGMVSLEHLDELIAAGLRMKPDDETIARLALDLRGHGMAVTTLIGQDIAVQEVRRLGLAWLTPEREAEIRRWNGASGVGDARERIGFITTQLPQDIVDLGEHVPDVSLRMLRAFHEAGVTLLVGTDSHSALMIGGRSALDEMDLFVRAGLEPVAALRAATVDAARVLGMEATLGVVAVGAAADLLLLDGNPIEDLRALRQPLAIVSHGVLHDREALDALLESAEAEGPPQG